MKINMLTRVRRHYSNEFAPRSLNRHNQRAWIRAIRLLGDRWLLAAPLARPDTPRSHF